MDFLQQFFLGGGRGGTSVHVYCTCIFSRYKDKTNLYLCASPAGAWDIKGGAAEADSSGN